MNKFPVIRFSNFENKWDAIILSKLFKFSRGRGYAKKDLSQHGEFEILLYGMLYTNYKSKLISTNSFTNLLDNSVMSKGNEIVIPSSGETSEDIARATAICSSDIILASDMNILTPIDDSISSHFIALLLTYGKANQKLIKKAQGNSVVHIYNSDLKNIEIIIPTFEEQTQIGEFFHKLDKLIELQQAAISKLEEMKKGFLRMIYPEYGKKISKISFSKEYSQWGISHLKNLSTEENKGKIQASEISNNEMDRTLYLDANRLNGGKSQYTSHKKDTNINDIIMLWDGSKAGQVFIGFEGILGSTLKRFVINDEYNSNFIYYQLKKHERRILLNYRTPNIPHVVKDFSSIFKINTLDDFNIQKAIGTFFNSLDCLIELENKELELLQEMKKGFLQKMFV